MHQVDKPSTCGTLQQFLTISRKLLVANNTIEMTQSNICWHLHNMEKTGINFLFAIVALNSISHKMHESFKSTTFGEPLMYAPVVHPTAALKSSCSHDVINAGEDTLFHIVLVERAPFTLVRNNIVSRPTVALLMPRAFFGLPTPPRRPCF